MILYFSGTGNSMTIAQKLAIKLNQNCLHINSAKELKSINDELIGFVFPVHNYDIPRFVAREINELVFPNTKYSFGIITHGGDKGNAILSLKNILDSKKINLDYHNDFLMPVNSRIMYGMVTDKINERIVTANSKVQSVISDIKNNIVNTDKIKKRHINAAVNSMADSNFARKRFTPVVDSEICTNCGICQKICPVRNIIIKDNNAFIENNCEQCTTCMHWCPELAIHFGNRKIRKEQQYHHPEVKVKDLFL